MNILLIWHNLRTNRL